MGWESMGVYVSVFVCVCALYQSGSFFISRKEQIKFYFGSDPFYNNKNYATEFTSEFLVETISFFW